MYAFGVILWELVSAQDFFGEISFMSAIEEKILNGNCPDLDVPGVLRRLQSVLCR